jgi:hypothetical protein
MKDRLLIIVGISLLVVIVLLLSFWMEKDDEGYVLFCNQWVFSNYKACDVLWNEPKDSLSIPEPEPEPMPESDLLQRQKQQQAKLYTQEIILTDFRGNEHQIKAINEYREEFESDYFLEQFVFFPREQDFEKDDLINFVLVEWGYQPEKCTSSKVEVYLRPYENYNSIEKISEWQKPDEECRTIDSDSDGHLIVNTWPMPGIFDPHETCTIPGEYRVVASNIEEEYKKEYGYYTCQKEKLIGEAQPWMELP